jgi:hypothetical protein
MFFCDLCSGLTIAKLYPPNIYHHGENLIAIERTGEFCQLCRLIYCCLQSTSQYVKVPELLFEGAVDEDKWGTDVESRNQSSIKLQIIPGHWSDRRHNSSEIRFVGIWMKTKYMLADFTLAVEEGTTICFCPPDSLLTQAKVMHWVREPLQPMVGILESQTEFLRANIRPRPISTLLDDGWTTVKRAMAIAVTSPTRYLSFLKGSLTWVKMDEYCVLLRG